MDNEKFKKHLGRMKEYAGMADAALQDMRNGKKAPRELRQFRNEIMETLERDLDGLLSDTEGLTLPQLRSLPNVVFATPAHEWPEDCEVDRFKVMEPMSGAMKGIGEMPRGKEKMLLILEGRGKAMIQGTRSEYKPVMIDRSEL